MEPRTIDRQEWQATFNREWIDDAETRIESAPGRVEIEFDESRSSVSAYYCGEATDIRVGDLQFVVWHDHLAVIRQHPPYPIERWTVLYDGPLPKRLAEVEAAQ